MTEKKQQQYEDENGYYVWRTVHGHPVKIYKEKSIYESIVMSNLQKSMQKELKAAEKRNWEYVADKISKMGIDNIVHPQVMKRMDVNYLNHLLDRYSEMEKKYPLSYAKTNSIRFTPLEYLTCDMSMSAYSCAPCFQELEINVGTNNNAKQVIKSFNDLFNKKEFMPADQYENYNITHEFGHLLEDDIVLRRVEKEYPGIIEKMKKWYVAVSNYNLLINSKDRYKPDYRSKIESLAEEIKKLDAELSEAKTFNKKQYRIIYNEINDIYSKEFAKAVQENKVTEDDYISNYGKSLNTEFFAECFANLNCGKPNLYGKALKIWLEEQK